MKQKMVIKVCMPCEKSRSKAMALAAKTHGVTSMAITGDARERLVVVGDGVDPVRLVSCLRKKIGHAEILRVEQVRDRRAEEEVEVEEEEPEPEPEPPQFVAVHPPPPPPQCYSEGYHYYYNHHPPPSRVVVCDEPSGCSIM